MSTVVELDVAALKTLLAEGQDHLLIDVRTAPEVARGAIEGARHLPLHLLPVFEPELAGARDRPLVFYCQSGARSAQACAFMLSRGYERVYNLRGGFIGWMQHGLPAAQITLRA